MSIQENLIYQGKVVCKVRSFYELTPEVKKVLKEYTGQLELTDNQMAVLETFLLKNHIKYWLL